VDSGETVVKRGKYAEIHREKHGIGARSGKKRAHPIQIKLFHKKKEENSEKFQIFHMLPAMYIIWHATCLSIGEGQ
jgi:hypothetical protein